MKSLWLFCNCSTTLFLYSRDRKMCKETSKTWEGHGPGFEGSCSSQLSAEEDSDADSVYRRAWAVTPVCSVPHKQRLCCFGDDISSHQEDSCQGAHWESSWFVHNCKYGFVLFFRRGKEIRMEGASNSFLYLKLNISLFDGRWSVKAMRDTAAFCQQAKISVELRAISASCKTSRVPLKPLLLALGLC